MQGFGWEKRGKQTTWKPKRRWEDNIKMHVTGKVWEGTVGIYFSKNRGQVFFVEMLISILLP
jgi:hypothetical protein